MRVIFEEFKGTGNMELTTGPKRIANRRESFPAIDLDTSSSTRRDDMLTGRKYSWL